MPHQSLHNSSAKHSQALYISTQRALPILLQTLKTCTQKHPTQTKPPPPFTTCSLSPLHFLPTRLLARNSHLLQTSLHTPPSLALRPSAHALTSPKQTLKSPSKHLPSMPHTAPHVITSFNDTQTSLKTVPHPKYALSVVSTRLPSTTKTCHVLPAPSHPSFTDAHSPHGGPNITATTINPSIHISPMPHLQETLLLLHLPPLTPLTTPSMFPSRLFLLHQSYTTTVPPHRPQPHTMDSTIQSSDAPRIHTHRSK